MSSKNAYLSLMLEGGSSRVFNCVEKHLKLRAEGVKDASFFKHEPFHNVVIIKEGAIARSALPLGRRLATKLYFPYNIRDGYEGGRSIYLHDPKLLEVLNEVVGLQGKKLQKENVQNDLKILQVMDGLPSLDAFLMRDALELDGLTPNPLYLDVSETERAAIYEFIRLRFEPLVRAALGDGTYQPQKVAGLVDKIWEARDLDALDPLIQACRFPKGEALRIFTSWKGINFYTFEYERCRPDIDALTQWLDETSVPRFSSATVDPDQIAYLKRSAIARLTHHRKVVADIVNEYDDTYAQFVSNPQGTANFIRFLNRSKELYWRLGESLSALDHATHCWQIVTTNFQGRRLPAEQLALALECLANVLVEDRSRDRTNGGNFAFA
jgi:hypothetical protein